MSSEKAPVAKPEKGLTGIASKYTKEDTTTF